MPIIELSMDGRLVMSVGDEKHTAITVGLISSPYSNHASLQVFAVRTEEPTPLILALLPPMRHQSLGLRCLRSGHSVGPGPEWLLDRGQQQDTTSRDCAMTARGAQQFALKVEIPGNDEQRLTVSGNDTLQLAFECHFASVLPQLQIGCFGEVDAASDDRWYRYSVPFGKTVKISVISP